MTLEQFARRILFGSTLEDKLLAVDLGQLEPSAETAPLDEIPAFPGRPARLANVGKAEFPSLEKLHEEKTRGEVLHFFANHELLAMELMALVLLRFPEAPLAFRLGLARTIQEEQSHMRLYIERMRELGVEFGDLPVSDFFWNSMSGVKSPLDFVVQMSLTFEQANLDFSLFYMQEVAKTGDAKTAAILERVYREEIGHVKHGLAWFNRWRENSHSESDWEAYKRLLPFPLTPRRAKGTLYSIEARREAGLSETFIRELKLCNSSKGRPPVVWLFNPHCDTEIARGKPGFTPTGGSQRLTQDIEHMPMFLANAEDLVLLKKRPSTEWLESLQQAGFEIPELVEEKPRQTVAERVRFSQIGGLQPWGWSPESLETLRPLSTRLVETSGGNSAWLKSFSHKSYSETGFGKLFSKSWSANFLKEWLDANPAAVSLFGEPDLVGATFKDWSAAKSRIDEILEAGSPAMAKASFGTSGTAVKKIATAGELTGPTGGWIKNTIEAQGEIVIEHWLNKTADLSIQMTVEEKRVQLLEARRFITGPRYEYRGTCLGRKLTAFDSEHLRFLHAAFETWHKLVRDLGTKLRSEGYQGPAGVDALTWRHQDGSLRLKPLVELNPRWTMGRVALALEAHLAPSVASGLWAFLSVREIKAKGFENAQAFAQELRRKHPVRLSKDGRFIESGVVFTNDPAAAQEVLTVLATLPNEDLGKIQPETSLLAGLRSN